MLKIVSDFPEMLEAAKKTPIASELKDTKDIKEIIVAGMGGSAISGDIAGAVLSEKITLPFTVVRNYSLPKSAGAASLLFAVSYSGNTEETLSCVNEAGRKGIPVIAISSGGRLKEIAEAKKYTFIAVPAGLAPRAALPYLLVPILLILEKLGIASGIGEDIDESVRILKQLRQEHTKEGRGNEVKQLAMKLLGKIPVIFASTGSTDAAGLRLKTQLNENSKVTALLSFFPELNHNEIVNLSILEKDKHSFSLVILRDEGDNERVKKRIEITKSLIGVQLGGVTDIRSSGKSKLARLLSLVYFGDFLSVYLAVLSGIDPMPVRVIDKLKKELGR
ncbi:MAG: bifunctional phosphoglucose/phosphomannose isomerase [Candidatus Saganbacteria bacterium]|nr:bifunctional phosphoglucose/phosphomannose isomerase [Candidatus Saganbacteria bacterium]